MAGKSILAHKLLTAGTPVGLDPTVDLCVSLQVVRPNECLAAMDAFVLAVAQVGLHMGPNVLSALETFSAAAFEEASEGVGVRVVLDQGRNLFSGNPGVFDDCLKAQIRD
jgi:hypothetical protein